MSASTAKFTNIGRDLFWRYFDMQDGAIRWTGYDDSNWWNNVAPTAREKKGEVTGRTYRINFTTDEVEILP